LISIPAGVLKMPFGGFSMATIAGAGLWCAILSWFGQQTIGAHPELLESPDAMYSVIKANMMWFVGAVVLLGALYGAVAGYRRKSVKRLK
jgi:membrane protein DedA with SNARE-associated domain